jgi:hypothetical protein
MAQQLWQLVPFLVVAKEAKEVQAGKEIKGLLSLRNKCK